MSANANDLRHFYAEFIGNTVAVTATAANAIPLAEALEPGRYVLRVLDYDGGTAVWVRQGPFDSLPDAAAAAPSTQFVASADVVVLNAPLITFMVHGGSINNPAQDNGLSLFSVGGNAVVHITKVSRGRN